MGGGSIPEARGSLIVLTLGAAALALAAPAQAADLAPAPGPVDDEATTLPAPPPAEPGLLAEARAADPLAPAGSSPVPEAPRTASAQGLWSRWSPLADGPARELPAAVAASLDLELPPPRCAGGPAPSLAASVDALGAALGVQDRVRSGLDLSPAAEAHVARLVGCVALHAAELEAAAQGDGLADDGDRTRWLAAARDTLAALDGAPDLHLPKETSCVDVLCLVQVGGQGDHRYDRRAAVVVDEGGDDTYANNAAGADPLQGVPLAVLHDRGAGQDRYVPDETDAYGAPTLGAGYQGGVGLLVDGGGDDLYRGLGTTMGAGFVGAGFLLDEGGHDTYDSPYEGPDAENPGQSQKVVGGAGVYGGVGVLADEAGDDTYTQRGVDSLGWGGAGFGLLRDQAGDDAYRVRTAATGDGTGSFDGNVSGVSVGTGEVGGVGLLVDGGGADEYACSSPVTYGCMGASYFGGSLGLLREAGGQDTYRLGVAQEKSLYTPGGLGGAGINGVGVLLEEGGDDAYESENRWSLGYGAAGAGLFVDGGGSDVYDTRHDPSVGSHGDGEAWAGSTAEPATSLSGLGVDLDRQAGP